MEWAQIFWGIVVAIAGIVGWLLQMHFAVVKIGQLEKDNAKLKDLHAEEKATRLKFAAHIQQFNWPENIPLNILIVGPKSVGKSSLAGLWTRALMKIEMCTSSHDLEIYEDNVAELSANKKRCSITQLDLNFVPSLQLRASVPPGEDGWREIQLRYINEQLKAPLAILLMIKANPRGDTSQRQQAVKDNLNYFSLDWLTKITRTIGHLDSLHSGVPGQVQPWILINKADEYPPEMSDAQIACEVEKSNHLLIERVTQTLGKPEIRVISVKDNRHTQTLRDEIITALLRSLPGGGRHLQELTAKMEEMGQKWKRGTQNL